jgi:hypothetical protein
MSRSDAKEVSGETSKSSDEHMGVDPSVAKVDDAGARDASDRDASAKTSEIDAKASTSRDKQNFEEDPIEGKIHCMILK